MVSTIRLPNPAQSGIRYAFDSAEKDSSRTTVIPAAGATPATRRSRTTHTPSPGADDGSRRPFNLPAYRSQVMGGAPSHSFTRRETPLSRRSGSGVEPRRTVYCKYNSNVLVKEVCSLLDRLSPDQRQARNISQLDSPWMITSSTADMTNASARRVGVVLTNPGGVVDNKYGSAPD